MISSILRVVVLNLEHIFSELVTALDFVVMILDKIHIIKLSLILILIVGVVVISVVGIVIKRMVVVSSISIYISDVRIVVLCLGYICCLMSESIW
jgi:hypothetical protein